MSKGSKRRPSQINKDQFEKNWEKIFGSKEKKDKKEKKNEPVRN